MWVGDEAAGSGGKKGREEWLAVHDQMFHARSLSLVVVIGAVELVDGCSNDRDK